MLDVSRAFGSTTKPDNQVARHRRQSNQAELFWPDTEATLPQRLDQLNWPPQERFPVNRASAQVRSAIWSDLESSIDPLMIAEYSSICDEASHSPSGGTESPVA